MYAGSFGSVYIIYANSDFKTHGNYLTVPCTQPVVYIKPQQWTSLNIEYKVVLGKASWTDFPRHAPDDSPFKSWGIWQIVETIFLCRRFRESASQAICLIPSDPGLTWRDLTWVSEVVKAAARPRRSLLTGRIWRKGKGSTWGGISGRRGRGEGLGHSRGGRRSFDGGHKGKWGYKLPFPGRQVNRHTWRPPPPSQTLRTAFLTSNHLTPPHPSLPSLTLPVYF